MSKLKYNISLSLEVDPDANFCGTDRKHVLSELEDLVYNSIYDIDDVTILSMEVEEDK
jgi:hypothetical protein